ncbi:MAG: beta-galactosidase [Acidobacteriia bacterium]|nr:beta-galactosidase [Terriglobia bacterium]
MKTCLSFLVCCALGCFGVSSPSHAENARVQIELVRSYPELRVDNKPFFVHSAAFFYSRLPRDQWEKSLRRHAELGINTIDLYIQWNWHEPEEGQLDFDGHSNPRRDLKGLLQLISKLGLKLIVRPGPVILNEWKNGGYPDWLLRRPEYKESPQDILEGRYPSLSGLSTTQSDEASRQWLENETHLRYTRKWFFDVMKILTPYLSSHQGNILFFQLDDDQAINRTNYSGPNFWRYMDTLRQDLADAAVNSGGRSDDIIPFINPTDMRVSAAGFGAGLPQPIAALGQWYMYPGANALSFDDSTNLQFFVEELKTQPRFPPMIIEFQAGWYAPGDDTSARPSDPENTLLASRTLFANGLRGLNYFPLQDTLYPAGYEVPWTNHYYAWEAALDINSNAQPRGIPVRRNGLLIQGMGDLLAQTHKHADVGIVYSLGAVQPQEKLTKEEILRISSGTMALQRYCMLNQVSSEYLDPEYQSTEQLRRHKLLLMPVFTFDPERGLALSPTAEKRLIEFVEGGGTLVFFPRAPQSGKLGDWFAGLKRTRVQNDESRQVSFLSKSASQVVPRGEIELYQGMGPVEEFEREFQIFARYPGNDGATAVGLERKVGSGRVMVLGMDFYSWTGEKAKKKSPGEMTMIGPQPNREQPSKNGGPPIDLNAVMNELIARGSVTRALEWSLQSAPGEDRDVTVELATTHACTGSGFISLVNFSTVSPRDLKVSLPASNPCLKPVEVPEVHLLPRDALVLPLHLPLRHFIAGETQDEIVAANTELLSVEGEPQHFLLGLYAPSNAVIILRLSDAEEWKFEVQGQPLATSVDASRGWVRVPVPASGGPIPLQFIDVEKTGRTGPFPVAEHNKDNRGATSSRMTHPLQVPVDDELHVNLRSAYHLPVREGLDLPLDPPILVLNSSAPAKLLLEVQNLTSRPARLTVEIHVNGYQLRASLKKISVDPRSVEEYEFNLYLFLKGVINPSTKFAEGKFVLKGGQKTIEKPFYMVTIDPGTAVAYATDLDRDGYPEVVLENSELRLIETPGAGARAFVLFDKRTRKNIFSSVGALRDKVSCRNELPSSKAPRQIRGYFGLHNRSYRFEILASGGTTAIARFYYDAPDVTPGGALIQKTITLHGSDGYFEVEFQVTPHASSLNPPQCFASANSVDKANLGGPAALVLDLVGETAQLIDRTERIPKEFSGEIVNYFKPFDSATSTFSYRIRYRLPQ